MQVRKNLIREVIGDVLKTFPRLERIDAKKGRAYIWNDSRFVLTVESLIHMGTHFCEYDHRGLTAESTWTTDNIPKFFTDEMMEHLLLDAFYEVDEQWEETLKKLPEIMARYKGFDDASFSLSARWNINDWDSEDGYTIIVFDSKGRVKTVYGSSEPKTSIRLYKKDDFRSYKEIRI